MSSPESQSSNGLGKQVRFGDFLVDLEGGTLRRGTENVSLRPKTFDVLSYLVTHHGRLVTRSALIDAVWRDTAVTDNSLSHCLVEIRRALGDNSQQLIRTVAKRGYIFTAPVLTAPESPPPEAVAVAPASLSTVWLLLKHRTTAVAALALTAIAAFMILRSRPERATVTTQLNFVQFTDRPGRELFPSLASDGSFVAYTARDGDDWDIHLQRIGARSALNLTRDCTADDIQPSFSPDGSQVAFRCERNGGGLVVMNASGGSIHRLSDFGFNPAWSPDGREIVFSTAMAWDPSARLALDSQLWVINRTSGKMRRLTDPAVTPDAVQPNWSPHGFRIAYWAVRDGQRDIWTMLADGTHPVPVTQDAAVDWSPVWAPDGRHLYFVSNRGGSMNLWRVAIEEQSGKVLGGPEAITLPSTEAGSISIAQGGRIAWVQQFTRANIQTVGFDPIRERVLSEPKWITSGSRQARYPDVSPDGQWLAFHDESGQDQIFVVRTDGTGLRQLTTDTHRNRYPRWSADGTRIAFLSNYGGEHDIWQIHPAGDGLDRLTHASAPAGYVPVWSPDAKTLAYTTRAGTFIIDTTRPWNEQSPEPVVVTGDANARLYPWSWSPDGRRLVGALLKPDGVSVLGLGVYSVESQQLQRVPAFGYNPVWLYDSRRLLMQDHRGKLYLVNTPSGSSRELLAVSPHSITGATLSRDARRIYLSVLVSEADIWLATAR